jgi:hypothetical protein
VPTKINNVTPCFVSRANRFLVGILRNIG